MRILRALPTLLVFLVAAAIGTMFIRHGPQRDRLPRGWNADSIIDDAMAGPVREYLAGSLQGRVLVWHVLHDRRVQPANMLEVEQCVVLIRYTAPDRSARWLLACLNRYPLQSTHFQLNIWYDSYVQFSQDLDRAPTDAEIYQFLKTSFFFDGEQDPSWEVTDAGVCSADWRRATGMLPVDFYDHFKRPSTRPSLGPRH